MAQSDAEWLEGQAQRLYSAKRSTIETAKLFATFIAAVAATLVATALQVGSPTSLDLWSAALLGSAMLETLVVVQCDQTKEVDHDRIFTMKALYNWSAEVTLAKLRVEDIAIDAYNRRVASRVRVATALQVALALAAGSTAAVSLLVG